MYARDEPGADPGVEADTGKPGSAPGPVLGYIKL